MAEIGQILYLPPPVANGRSGAIPGANSSANSGEERARRAVPAIEADTAGAQARAKQFRFRVYDGGRPGEAQPRETMAGDNGLPTRRTARAQLDESQRSTRQDAGNGTQGGQSFASFGTASAPFLAQLIAQEQMQAGLHDPPLREADRAYRQAGGEPALNEGSIRPRFQIAV